MIRCRGERHVHTPKYFTTYHRRLDLVRRIDSVDRRMEIFVADHAEYHAADSAFGDLRIHCCPSIL